MSCKEPESYRAIKPKPMKRSDGLRYVFVVFLPPLAVLLCGKPIQAIINIPLCGLYWIPAVLHALFVVNSHIATRQAKELVGALGA
jgi:uncharacterized membrane protein YqaE (UPF0057 family)